MHSDFLRRVISVVSALMLCVGLAACASAPVQQMSDARQAIRAAQEAGAAATAAKPLSEAQAALSRAEGYLDKRLFRAARRSAQDAHSKAVEALEQARASKSP